MPSTFLRILPNFIAIHHQNTMRDHSRTHVNEAVCTCSIYLVPTKSNPLNIRTIGSRHRLRLQVYLERPAQLDASQMATDDPKPSSWHPHIDLHSTVCTCCPCKFTMLIAKLSNRSPTPKPRDCEVAHLIDMKLTACSIRGSLPASIYFY
ncbi:hypothetical protein M758_11G063400 [Ceratodon purpureus]|nr:hypothetical protein M758_11G063400 [Ceratodon purpureus]